MFGHLLSSDDHKTTRTRFGFFQVAIVAVFLALFGTLIQKQIFTGQYFRRLADNNRIRTLPIHATRGVISDHSGVVLANNLPAFRLSGSTISKDQAIAAESQGLKSGQTLEIDSTRTYPFKDVFAHVLGYVTEISVGELGDNYRPGDKIGRGGVEEAQEKTLRGIDGRELVEVDANGNKLRTISQVSPVAGNNLTLTLDATLQEEIVTAMQGRTGVAIVSNPKSGEILALASLPSFDPNLFTDLSISTEERTRLLEQIFKDSHQPLFNRGISGTYPPGSTFKIITATAALESKAINKSTLIEDTGVLVIGPYKFPNWKWLAGGGVEGNLNVVGAIQRSNDIFFYRAGERTGVETITDWAKKFGLGRPLGIDLPSEASGLVPDKAYRDTNVRDWYLGDTYHLSIGQGDLLVTPLQMNFWTNVIANGGLLCKPHLLGKSDCQSLGISAETISLVKEGMRQACMPGGTGWTMFDFKPQVFCKTGTAEYGDQQNRVHAWFTMFLEEPSVSLTILIEGGGEGSDVAGPIARKVLDNWLKK